MSAVRLYVQDVTLRDGMHATRHRLAPERAESLVRPPGGAQMQIVEMPASGMRSLSLVAARRTSRSARAQLVIAEWLVAAQNDSSDT